MTRRIGDELNELRIHDNLSNSEIILKYRMPTTQETIRYGSETIIRKRNKIVSRIGETRQKYGAMILEGFRKGDFERKVGDKYVPISSDSDSEHYDPQWKDYLKKYASDLIEVLAVHVFETPAQVDEDQDEEEEMEIQEEDAEKN